MNNTVEIYSFLENLKKKNELIFRCALSNIINDGISAYKHKSNTDMAKDIDYISEQYQKDEKNLPSNRHMGYTLDFAIEIYKTTVLICKKAETIDIQICISNMSFYTPEIKEVQNYQKAEMFDEILDKSIDEYYDQPLCNRIVFETICENGFNDALKITSICEDLKVIEEKRTDRVFKEAEKKAETENNNGIVSKNTYVNNTIN